MKNNQEIIESQQLMTLQYDAMHCARGMTSPAYSIIFCHSLIVPIINKPKPKQSMYFFATYGKISVSFFFDANRAFHI